MSKPTSIGVPNWGHRILYSERLETRVLLAGDMAAAWQNPANCNDVNQDGLVTAIDALQIVRSINIDGARELGDRPASEPGGNSDIMMVDANGDGYVSASDALQVFRAINAQGEGEVLRIRLEAVDDNGNPINRIQTGGGFQLRGYVQDLRDGAEAQGVFAAYLDVTYDANLVSVTNPITFGPSYPNGPNGDLDTPGLIDEVGAFAGASALGPDEMLLFSVPMRADAAGNVTFAGDPADILPRFESLFFGDNDAVLETDIEFQSFALTVEDATAQVDPSISQIVANDLLSLEIESPRNLPVDADDPFGQGLTYSVAVEDPSLLQAEFTTGNRSWTLDVDGFGTLVFELFEDRASRATEQFIALTEEGFFDGISFHRVIDGFVIQGGDPTGTGTGGSLLPDFDDQFHLDLQHNQVGVLSMAKTADDTNNSQFFVTDTATPHLDFNHTIFGQLVEGFDVLDAISAVDTGFRDKPNTDVVITNASVVSDSEDAILTVKALDSSGATNVTVTATDGQGKTVTNSFAVSLAESSRNSQPFLDDIPGFTAPAGSVHEFQLTYQDIEGDDVRFSAQLVSPNAASVSVSDAGLVSVVIPAEASPGSEVIVDVTVSEGSFISGVFDRQRVEIMVESGVTGSVADDTYTVDEDSVANALDVLANDGLSETATITNVTMENASGQVSIAQDGKSVFYSPTKDFFGEAVFVYTVADNTGSFTGRVTVTVDNVIDPPNAGDDFFPQDLDADDLDRLLYIEDSDGDIPLTTVLSNDLNVDLEEQELTLITSASDPQFGSITFNAIQIRYTPAADFFGTDTFTYTTTGSTSGLSSTGTITIEVAERNDAPVARDDNRNAVMGVTTVFSAADLLANDTAGPDNESSQNLELVALDYQGGGSVTLNNDGSVAYTPAADFAGTETITYTIQDDGTTSGAADPLTASGVLTVTVGAGQATVDDEFDVEFETATELDITANDDTSQGLTLVVLSRPSNGFVGFQRNVVTYLGKDGFVGSDSFTYTVALADGGESTSTVNINVLPQPSSAVADDFVVIGTTTLNVLANDVTGIGASSLAVAAVTQPANGATSIVNDQIVFEPGNSLGADSFEYTLIDDNGNESTATVSVTVEARPNNPPVANDDSVNLTSDDGQQALGVLGNDSTQPDTGETLSIVSIIVAPTNGSVVVAPSGADLLYTPNQGFVGTDTVEYRVSDGNGGFDTATVTINVTESLGVVARDDSFIVVSPGLQTYNVLGNDQGGDDVLTIVAVQTDNTNGTVRISDDGTRLLYSPNFDGTTSDSFTYTVADGEGNTDQATVSISISDLVSDSFYAGEVFIDADNNGFRDLGEHGLGGVTIVLEGTDDNGNPITEQVRTSIDGAFRFDGIGPGDYTITQVQPEFISTGQNILLQLPSTSDVVDVEVTERLIASEGNSYGERGLISRFSVIDALSSDRQPGLFVVMDGDELAWAEDRGGWDDVGSIGIVSSGDALTLSSANVGSNTLSMSDRSQVALIGRAGRFTVLRINGTSGDVLSSAAVDQLFAT